MFSLNEYRLPLVHLDLIKIIGVPWCPRWVLFFLFVSLFVFPLTSTALTFVQTDITAFLEHVIASFLSASFMVSLRSLLHIALIY